MAYVALTEGCNRRRTTRCSNKSPGAMTKGEPIIRVATVIDVPMVASIVQQAYHHYISRIGKPPGPMLDDYTVRVREGAVWVIEQANAIFGIIVLLPASDYLLLDNIAVAPERQGLGIGRRLLDFAEGEALRRGYREIRLYTHETMIENQRLYSALGYEETGRATQAGYDRVFMCKQLGSGGGKLTPR